MEVISASRLSSSSERSLKNNESVSSFFLSINRNPQIEVEGRNSRRRSIKLKIHCEASGFIPRSLGRGLLVNTGGGILSTVYFCYDARGGENIPAAVQNDVYLLQDHFLPLQNGFLPLQSRFLLLRNHFFPLHGDVLLSHEDFFPLRRSFALFGPIFSFARRTKEDSGYFSSFFDIGQ